ncbi:MAG: hypothetical protein JXB88_20445 [Spirochaetales bacterium]|nr:hypothetical protein [Spirochaetales bacterium]
MGKTAVTRIFIIISIIMLFISSGISLMNLKEFQRISSGMNVLDMRLTYSPGQVSSLLDHIGYEGRRFYCLFLIEDFVFIIFFAIIQSLIISRLIKKNSVHSRWHNLIFLPYARAFFDVFENVMLFILLVKYPLQLRAIAFMANVMTVSKWISLALIMIVIMINSAILIYRSIILFFRRKEYGKTNKDYRLNQQSQN